MTKIKSICKHSLKLIDFALSKISQVKARLVGQRVFNFSYILLENRDLSDSKLLKISLMFFLEK